MTCFLWLGEIGGRDDYIFSSVGTENGQSCVIDDTQREDLV